MGRTWGRATPLFIYNDIEDDEIRALFRTGSSPGGARPKVLVKIDDGSQWIAKFPSVRDTMDIVSIEAATMLLAKKAGLNVPECRTVSLGKKKSSWYDVLIFQLKTAETIWLKKHDQHLSICLISTS